MHWREVLENILVILFVIFQALLAALASFVGLVIRLVVGPFSIRWSTLLNVYVADLFWWYMGGVLIEGWGRAKIHFYGESLPLHESVVVMMNHRMLIDWAFLFLLAGRCGRLGTLKFFIKNTVKYIPGFGWGLMLLDNIFISRRWTLDHDLIENAFYKLKKNQLPFWIVSFLEGTRVTPQKLAQAQEYCRSCHLPILKHVLFPRTKGFVATISSIRQDVDAVYSITYSCDNGRELSLADLVMRRMPDLHFHMRRFSIEELPRVPDKIIDWCIERWCEMDQIFEYFVASGAFPNPFQTERWRYPYRHQSLELSL